MRYVLLILAILCSTAEARDPAQVRAFRKTHPCPSTGKTTGACPGWVVDHAIPLCLQALVPEPLDVPANMQYQTYAESLKKDRLERQACREMRRAKQERG